MYVHGNYLKNKQTNDKSAKCYRQNFEQNGGVTERGRERESEGEGRKGKVDWLIL